MLSRSFVWAGAGLVLLGAPLAADSGSVLAGAWIGAGAASPLAPSTKFVLEVADLAAGVELPLTGGDAQVAVLSRGEPVADVRLEDASGLLRLSPEEGGGRAERFREPVLESYDLPADGLALALRSLPPGSYRLRGESAAAEPVVVVVNELASPLLLQVRTRPLAARAGETVTVEAFLTLEGRPLSPAQVLASPLLDSAHGRGEPLRLREVAPGHWSATLAAPGGADLRPLSFRVEAAGTTPTGERFRRTAITGAMVSPGRADLAAELLEFDGSTLSVPVRGAAGAYRLEVVFGRGDGGAATTVAFSREDFALAGEDEDTVTVTLAVPPEAAGADRAVLRLLDRSRLAVEREIEVPVAVPGLPSARGGAPTPVPDGKRAAAVLYGDEV